MKINDISLFLVFIESGFTVINKTILAQEKILWLTKLKVINSVVHFVSLVFYITSTLRKLTIAQTSKFLLLILYIHTNLNRNLKSSELASKHKPPVERCIFSNVETLLSRQN